MSDLVESFGEMLKTGDDFPIDFDRAWQWVGYSRKDAALRALQENFSANDDYHLHKKVEMVKRKQGGGTAADRIMLSADCFKGFAMMAGTERGKEVRRYFIQCEKMLAAVIGEARAMKIARRNLTDTLLLTGEAERTHGHAYSLYTNLVYKAVLGMDAKKYREALGKDENVNVRELLTPVQAESVRQYEDLVRSMVAMRIPYEQIRNTIEVMSKKIGKELTE